MNITFETAAPITLTVSQMFSISIALGEASSWNEEHGFTQAATDLDLLRTKLREQFKPYFQAIDSYIAGLPPNIG